MSTEDEFNPKPPEQYDPNELVEEPNPDPTPDQTQAMPAVDPEQPETTQQEEESGSGPEPRTVAAEDTELITPQSAEATQLMPKLDAEGKPKTDIDVALKGDQEKYTDEERQALRTNRAIIESKTKMDFAKHPESKVIKRKQHLDAARKKWERLDKGANNEENQDQE